MLYRVAQEAVWNALRHGRARRIALTLLVDEERATLDIVDNGTGFDVPDALRRHDGIGIFSMRKRMTHVNGTLDITSGPGRGTRVRAAVPLCRAEADET
jgi:signal transduction histidine kinase